MGTVSYPSSSSWFFKTREEKVANQMVRKLWVHGECLFNGHGSKGLLLHQPVPNHVLEGPSPITSRPWTPRGTDCQPSGWKQGNETTAIYHLSKTQTPLVLNITARHTKTTASPRLRGTWNKTEGPAPQLQGKKQECGIYQYPCVFYQIGRYNLWS